MVSALPLDFSTALTFNIPLESISKDTSIYLEEDRAIHLDASAAGDLAGVCSYEEIDDA